MENTCILQMPQPNEKQRLAFLDRHRYIGYGGARGGGKSWFVRWKAILLCLKYPGIRVLITRRSYRELLHNHMIPLETILRDTARFSKSEKCFHFPNGSTIWFGYCAADSDLGQYQGAEYDIWFADEASQFQENWLTQIDVCVRGANAFPKRTYYTLNPGGPSHAFFRRLFIERRFLPEEHPEDYSFIQALCTDNHALMRAQPEYLRALEKLPHRLREAWLYGKWDVYEGQFFEDFFDRPDHYADRRFTHVIEPFEIPAGWRIYRSFDWGYARPFSCGWWAVDYDGTVYRILELYGCTGNPNEGVKWPPDRVFREIARIEREHRWLKGKVITGVADPAIWEAGTGKSIAEVAGEQGIYFAPGDNKRLPGWLQLHYRLQLDEGGFPMLYIFKNCAAAIRTLPLLQYDPHRPEDLDTAGEDHAADEMRYFCMSRPIKPGKGRDISQIQNHPLGPILDLSPEDLTAARRRPGMEVILG